MNITNIILTDISKDDKNNPCIIQLYKDKLTKLQQEEKLFLLGKIVRDIIQSEVSLESLTCHIDEIKKYYIIKSYQRIENKSGSENTSATSITLFESILDSLDNATRKLINDLKNHVEYLFLKEENLLYNLTPRRKTSILETLGQLSDLITYRFRNNCEMAILYDYIQYNATHESDKAITIQKAKEFIVNIRKTVFDHIYEKKDNSPVNIQTEPKDSEQISNFQEQRVQTIKNYDKLLGVAGTIYNKLMIEYNHIGLIDSTNRFSHELIYEIASQLFCHGLTPDQFAHDITNSIINYIHNNTTDKNNNKYSDIVKIKKLIGELVIRYLDGRLIKHYYYYLRMCSNILMYVMPCYDKNTDGEIEKSITDEEKKKRDKEKKWEIASIITEKTRTFNFSFLDRLQDNEITEHIINTYESRIK